MQWQAETMRWLFTLLILLSSSALAAPLPRVVSLNMCADPYLMAFAAPEQVRAITIQSQDPALSPFAETAQRHRATRGTVEEILQLKPDIVIASPFGQSLRQSLLRAQGIEVLRIAAANNYQQARQEILRIGEAIGRADAARAYLAALDARLDKVTPRDPRPRILPLQRRGFTVGENNILGDIIALSGGRLAHNQTAHFTPIGLEAAVALDSDFVLTTDRRHHPDDRGSEFLAHPALAARFDASQWLSLESNLVTCAGATTPLAVEALTQQLSASDDRRD